MDHRIGLLCLPLLLLVLAVPRPAVAVDDAELRERVPQAIERAQKYLLSQQDRNGSFEAAYPGSGFGMHCLAVLALVNSGMEADDPAIARGLEYLRSQRPPAKTYELSMAIQALVAAGQKEDFARVARMAKTLELLQQPTGGWHYTAGGGGWDNSNTQFAILALRDAAYFGVTISETTWDKAQRHWLQSQQGTPDARGGAGWDYTGGGRLGGVTGSMTVAGIAGLTITDTFVGSGDRAAALDCCGRGDDRAERAVDAGARWLANHFSVSTNPSGGGTWHFYYLYGLERAGRLTGRRFFGNADWYREGAKLLVEAQQVQDGSWNGGRDPSVDTAMGLLFLSKGLSPVLVNKLRYDTGGQTSWNRHPADIKNLTDFLSTRPKWPKLMTWQEVDLPKAVADNEGLDALLQAPVQVIEGDDDLAALGRAERELLAEYLAQGGFLLIVNNCQSDAFDLAARRLVRDLVPDDGYRLEPLDPSHDIYRAEYLFSENPPVLEGVEFGCRTAIVYAAADHACRWDAWNRNLKASYQPPVVADIVRSMQLGSNILSYATGRELVDKLSSPEAVERAEVPLRENPLPVARLRHQGGWDAAPGALRNLMAAVEKFGVTTPTNSPVVSGDDPKLYRYPLLYMHGRRNFELSPAEWDGLVDHLNSGGVLFADACCGADAFDESFRRFVVDALGEPLAPIPADDELFRLPAGHDIRRVSRRIPAGSRSGPLEAEIVQSEPVLEGVQVDGRWAVIYSKYDLSCALERQATVACEGYVIDDAVRIGTNVVLYSVLQDVVALPDTADAGQPTAAGQSGSRSGGE